MMQHVSEFLDQLIGHVGYLTCLTNSRERGLLFFIELGWITYKEPNGIFGGEILQGSMRRCSLLNDPLILAQRDQEPVDLSIRSNVSLLFDLPVDLSTIRASLLPS